MAFKRYVYDKNFWTNLTASIVEEEREEGYTRVSPSSLEEEQNDSRRYSPLPTTSFDFSPTTPQYSAFRPIHHSSPTDENRVRDYSPLPSFDHSLESENEEDNERCRADRSPLPSFDHSLESESEMVKKTLYLASLLTSIYQIFI